MRSPLAVAVLSLGLLIACPSPALHDDGPPPRATPVASGSAEPGPASDPKAGAVQFTAVVRPSEATGHGNAFRGVVLQAEDGTAWVASYSRDGLWDSFAGSRVAVTGERYAPEGRAIVGPHVRVTTLKVLEPRAEPYAEMGPVVTLEGHFEDWVVPEGEAWSGASFPRFVVDGGARTLFVVQASLPSPALAKNAHVTVRGRTVAPSPFVRSFGGPFLWVYEATPK
jgi:hypothetical protein